MDVDIISSFSTDTQYYCHEDNNNKFSTSLWRAVITQALMDAGSNSKKTSQQTHKKRAIEWLLGISQEEDIEENFRIVCENAGWTPELVRKKAINALGRGCQWRKEKRTRKGITIWDEKSIESKIDRCNADVQIYQDKDGKNRAILKSCYNTKSNDESFKNTEIKRLKTRAMLGIKIKDTKNNDIKNMKIDKMLHMNLPFSSRQLSPSIH